MASIRRKLTNTTTPESASQAPNGAGGSEPEPPIEEPSLGRAALPRDPGAYDDVVVRGREDDVVGQGQEAWLRRKADARMSFDDWLLIGTALDVGRKWATEISKGEPGSKLYNTQFGRWLEENGFADIDKSDRAKLFLIMGRLPEIAAWRETLSEPGRLRLNHPSAVWRAWEAHKAKMEAGEAADRDEATEEEEAPETGDVLMGHIILIANKATGLARDVRELRGELDDVTVQTVKEAAKAWAETLADCEKRLPPQDEPIDQPAQRARQRAH